MTSYKIVVLEGDQTGQELLDESLRVLSPEVTRLPLEFEHFDLSLENRRKTQNQVVVDSAKAMRRTGLGLKAATITPETGKDVGSPNAILRKELEAEVILRVGRRIPGVRPVGGVHAPIAVVRMAVDGAYNAKEWKETVGDDEFAYRTVKISRRTSRAVAEFAFQYAEKVGAKVFGGPKYTVSHIYESMFKEEMDAAAERHKTVRYDPQLIDATLALLLGSNGESLVIPAMNRDGDLLSDMVLKMFGTIAASESLVLSYDPDSLTVDTVMAEAPHGTAPSLEGKNVANPMAMIMAGASLLTYIDDEKAQRASRAIKEAAFESVMDGVKTSDIGGHSSTTDFTDSVINRTKNKLEVWESLG